MQAREYSLINNEMQKLMEEKKVPGISIIIIENAKIIYCNHYGLKHSETNDPVDDNTVFEAASLSKPVFAYAVLHLVENEKLNLDTPLCEYLSYPDVENDERLKLITARMVLNHTTGFPNWRAKDEKLKIYFRPGEKFSYSGEGYVYLQKVVEQLSGLSLEDYVSAKVFIPLEMKHSSYVWQNEYEQIKASGHNLNGDPVENPKPTVGNAAFTLHTTTLDYAKFVIAILKGIGLKSQTIGQMICPQTKVEEGCINCIDKCSNKISDSIFWGLGWGLQCTSQGDSFWHWGDNNGFKSYIAGFRTENKGIIIFTNGANGLSVIQKIMYKITDVHQPAFDWLDSEYSLNNQKNK